MDAPPALGLETPEGPSCMSSPSAAKDRLVRAHRKQIAKQNTLSPGKCRAADNLSELETHRQTVEKDADARALIIAGMQNNRLCGMLDDDAQEAIFEEMQYFAFNAGDTVVTQGEAGCHFFVVHAGSLVVTVNGKNCNVLERGTAFGAISLLYDCPRTATVVAQENSGLWGADGDVFRRVLREHSQKYHSEIRGFIDRVQVFDGLTERQKERLSECSFLTETFKPGARVYSQGEAPVAIYFLRKGDLAVMKGGHLDASGALIDGTKSRELRAGDHFGVRAALYGNPHSSTVVAESHSFVLCISLEQLRQVFGDDLRGCLERSFVLSVLRSVPVISQLSFRNLNQIAEAMKVQSYDAGAKIKGGKQLIIVMDGEISGKSKDVGDVVVGRGECYGEGALAELAGTKKGPKSGLTGLVAGADGARAFILAKEDLAKALKGLGMTAMNTSEQAEDRLRKTLLAKKVPVFHSLSEEQINSIAGSFVLRKYTKGAMIIEQHEVGNSFFVIANGEATVLVNGSQVRTLGTGAYFGERALLFDERRSASVQVSSGVSEVWSLDRTAFQSVVTAQMRQELVHRIRLQDISVSLKSLEHVRFIGVGGFGSVRLVEHRWSNQQYALKSVALEHGKVPEGVKQECTLLAEMDHPFILRLVGTFETRSNVCIVTELITGGALYDYLDELGVLSRQQAQLYIGTLVLVLEALHDRNIIYRDLKPENIMLDGQGYLKLIDFGLAKKLDRARRTFTVSGTVYYVSPEAVRGKGYGTEADIWSLGVVCYELVCGKLPFGEGSEADSEVLEQILEKELDFPEGYNDELGMQLMKGLLMKYPGGRLGSGTAGWDEIKAAKFFEKEATAAGGLFGQIVARELTPPVVPGKECFPNEEKVEKQAAAMGVSLDEIAELGGSDD